MYQQCTNDIGKANSTEHKKDYVKKKEQNSFGTALDYHDLILKENSKEFIQPKIEAFVKQKGSLDKINDDNIGVIIGFSLLEGDVISANRNKELYLQVGMALKDPKSFDTFRNGKNIRKSSKQKYVDLFYELTGAKKITRGAKISKPSNSYKKTSTKRKREDVDDVNVKRTKSRRSSNSSNTLPSLNIPSASAVPIETEVAITLTTIDLPDAPPLSSNHTVNFSTASSDGFTSGLRPSNLPSPPVITNTQMNYEAGNLDSSVSAGDYWLHCFYDFWSDSEYHEAG